MSSPELRQVFLPYHNFVTGEQGWQFGLPPRRDLSGLAAHIATFADMSVLLVHADGTIAEQPHPILRAPDMAEGRVPLPDWAWVPFEFDDGPRYARVVAPERAAGSLPLNEIPLRRVPSMDEESLVIYFPKGLEMDRVAPTWTDSPSNIDLVGSLLEEPNFAITLGDHEFCHVHAVDGQVAWIAPTQFPMERGLWTTHLIRMVRVFCSP